MVVTHDHTKVKDASQEEKGASSQRIDLGDAVEISVAAELHARLKQALETQSSVVLDAESVEIVDTSALQVLCVFLREAHSFHIDVQWHQPSEQMLSAARLLGMTELLSLPASQ
ncbi:MAG: STAS domain-containing protein [Gammaproteobacteria bacterium]|nr:STAS domain-containing protein [Gammaproteobacteria bacterium]